MRSLVIKTYFLSKVCVCVIRLRCVNWWALIRSWFYYGPSSIISMLNGDQKGYLCILEWVLISIRVRVITGRAIMWSGKFTIRALTERFSAMRKLLVILMWVLTFMILVMSRTRTSVVSVRNRTITRFMFMRNSWLRLRIWLILGCRVSRRAWITNTIASMALFINTTKIWIRTRLSEVSLKR